jgi:hypothetical protein
MIADPRTNAAHDRRWALWLFMFVGVVLHSSLCPPNVHASVLGAMARTCVVPAAGAPPSTGPSAEASTGPAADSGRLGDAGGPCAPAPRPHHHAPCGVMSHRASAQDRSAGSWQAGAAPRCPLATPAAGAEGAPGHARPWGTSSRPPVRRSGAGLLIDLCASRT